MLILKRLLELFQPGNWFITSDLKDEYFHVEVTPKHRKFLRLLFGCSLALRTFSRRVDTALQPLCDCGMRVFYYLNDLIVIAKSRKWALFHTV